MTEITLGIRVACRKWQTAGTILLVFLFSLYGTTLFALPFTETFDSLTLGAINGQNSWTSTPTNYVSVQTNAYYYGTKAVKITNSIMTRAIEANTSTNVWIDFYTWGPRRNPSSYPAPSNRTTIAFFVNSNGYVVARNGSSWNICSNFVVSKTAWTRFTMNLNYTSDKWSIYACDSTQNKISTLLASNLSFNTTSTNDSPGKLRVNGKGETIAGYIDSITMDGNGATNMPLCIDNDLDQMADRWEIAYLRSITNSSGGGKDSDADSFVDFYEYIAATDPSNSASYLSITNCDLASETGNNIQIIMSGGNYAATSPYAGDNLNRKFAVYAATNASSSKTEKGSSLADTSGSTSWIDTNAVLLSKSKFYNVAAQLGGQSYINASTEWAMHAQNRPANQKFLMCVPVNHESYSSKNLNSKLGQQLARGLRPSATTNGADKIQCTISNQWRQFYLITNSAGIAYWWDDSVSGPNTANVYVAAGTAFWVVRGTNSATRTNSVFTGKSFTATTVTNFAFSTNYGGWTMFGWAMPQPKTHTGATADELGFVAAGAEGGQTTDPDFPASIGDQIWIWDNNTWKNIFWLLGNYGLPAYDGRWWDSEAAGGGAFARFSLECGKAYYYYHPASNQWNPVNFTWSPTNAP